MRAVFPSRAPSAPRSTRGRTHRHRTLRMFGSIPLPFGRHPALHIPLPRTMVRGVETPAVVEVPGGPTLEASLDLAEPATAGLVLCHPHPLYGGDMDNPVVTRAAEVARALGVSTLRFNFRGVGDSTGTHDEGWGEQE